MSKNKVVFIALTALAFVLGFNFVFISNCAFDEGVEHDDASDKSDSSSIESLKITWNPYVYAPNSDNVEYRNMFVDAILNYEDIVVLPSRDITEEVYIGVLFEFPLSKLTYSDVDYETNTISIEYRYPKDEHDRLVNEFGRKVEDIIESTCYSNYDDVAKALAIHKYLSTNVQYYYHEGTDDYFDNINAYSALINNLAICSGYAEAYSHLLGQLGIKTYIVNGMTTEFSGPDTYSHAWNLVKLNGKYYHCDATWENGYTLGSGLQRFGMTSEEVKLDFPSKWNVSGVNNSKMDVPTSKDMSFVFARYCDEWEYDSDTKSLSVKYGAETRTEVIK